MAHFLCLTAEGGVPLFYKNTGNLKPLPFPVIGSLNGVHMFSANHDVTLRSTITDDSKIIRKDYHNSISLTIVTQDDNASDQHLTALLDYAFNSMVLLYGLEDLTNIKNVDRFKREIKVCFKLLDTLLDPDRCLKCGPLTSAVEVIAAPENSILQSYINAFAEAADSPYGCVLVSGKVAVATSKWWDLSTTELVLLPLLMTSLPKCSSRDVAIFLPDNSPTVPHRLLTFELIPEVDICIICGPSPALAELELEVDRYWRPAIESLRSIARLPPRNYPNSVSLDSSILGFLVINPTTHRCLCSVCPHSLDNTTRQAGLTTLTLDERRRALCSFYKTTMGNVWSPTQIKNDESEKWGDMHENFTHPITDTYSCTERHKIYALRNGPRIIMVLYGASMPTYAMRSVTQKTFQILFKDKNVIV